MKRNCFFYFFLLLFFLGSEKIYSQKKLESVKWEFSYNEIDDTTGELILKAKLDPNWHTYSQTQKGDGPLPTVFKFVKTVDYDLIGSVVEPDPIRRKSDISDADVAMFSIEAIFVQKVNRNTKKEFLVMGEVEFMACNDIMCLPPKTIKFSINIPQSELK